MHPKPDLRVSLKWMIAGSGSVIATVICFEMGRCMAIPMLAIGATGVVLIPFLLLFLRFSKQTAVRYIGFAFCGVAFFPMFGFFFQFMLAQTSHYGVNVTPSEVPGIDIPPDATEICYYSKSGPTRLIAQFTVTESGFRDWMKQGDRSIGMIDGCETVMELNAASPPESTILQIESGYRWDDYDEEKPHDDSGTTIVFDKTRSRVYVCVTLW